ncbi:Probable receptor-like protein kinase At1g49730 [Linum perenne]
MLMILGLAAMFQKFGSKEIKISSDTFTTIIGENEFGVVYKSHISDGSVMTLKWMKKVTGQGENEFCKEIELLDQLHHHHVVSLRGFCVEKHER